jgi:site-specific DNA-methyltransferase (adenine-specific)
MQYECKLIHGDFYSEYRNFEPGSFDLILTDPPYNRLQQAGQEWDVKIDWDSTEGILANLIKPTGWIIMFCDFLLAVELTNTFCHKLEWHGFHIWQKPGGAPSNKFHPIHNSEHILIFRKKGVKVSDLTFNPKTVIPRGKPYIKRNTSNDFSTRRQMKSEVNSNLSGERWVKTVLTGPSKPNMTNEERASISHPTMKPLNVIQGLIRCYSNPGDLILDPFAGSGSTLIAAFKENRHAIGIEKDEKFYQESLKRTQAATMQGSLF